MEKQEKKEKKILTENRMATINKRETSFEGLVSQFENGEDGIYGLITEDKHIIFRPKVTITQKDIEEIEPLRQLRESIARWEERLKTATGRDAFIIKKTIIELRKDQYLIKDDFRRPIKFKNITRGMKVGPIYPNEEWIDPVTKDVAYSGLSFCDPNIVSAILQHYESLKVHSVGKFLGDTWYVMLDFEHLLDNSLKDYPMYRRIVEYKTNQCSNVEIQNMLQQEFGFSHSLEYISSLWRNKIPKLIAGYAQNEWIVWYYTFEEKGKWKKCSRCGQIKLAHTRFFSINKTSKDGFYSICKECRNKKNKEKNA